MIDVSSKNAWKRPFKNAKKLLWGEGGKAIFGLGTVALTARTLGVSDFGALTILMSAVAIIAQFVTFSSWQMVLRYGAEALSEYNVSAYRHVVGFALTLEILASIVGAIFIALMSSYIMLIFKIPQSVGDIVPWIGIILTLSAISNISDGTLRLTDRFHVISAVNVFPKALKFFIVCYLFWIEAGLAAFIYTWFFTSAFSGIVRLFVAWHYFQIDIRKLNAKAIEATTTPWEKGKFFSPKQGTWKFAFGLYADSCFGVGTQQFSVIILGILLGTEASGLYKIADKISASIASPVNKLMLPAVFTDMAWLNSNVDNKPLVGMVLKLGAVMGSLAAVSLLILIFIGDEIIKLVAGPEYLSAYFAMLFLAANAAIWSATFTLYPLLMTAGHVYKFAVVRLFEFGVFLAILPMMISEYKVTGAAASLFIASIPARFLLIYFVTTHLRHNK